MRHAILITLVLGAQSLLAQTVTTARWWIDDDASDATTTSVGATTDLVYAATADLPALDKAFHTITWQFMDSEGLYSVPYTTWFSRATGPVNGYEWWLDEAIADRTGGTIGPSTVVNLIDEIPLDTDAGVHTFTIRFRSTVHAWSVPLTTEVNVITHIEELPGITQLILFPNPVSDQLALRIDGTSTDALSFEVFDTSGRSVLRTGDRAVAGPTRIDFDTNALAAGTYSLRIRAGNNSWSTLFVKQ